MHLWPLIYDPYIFTEKSALFSSQFVHPHTDVPNPHRLHMQWFVCDVHRQVWYACKESERVQLTHQNSCTGWRTRCVRVTLSWKSVWPAWIKKKKKKASYNLTRTKQKTAKTLLVGRSVLHLSNERAVAHTATAAAPALLTLATLVNNIKQYGLRKIQKIGKVEKSWKKSKKSWKKWNIKKLFEVKVRDPEQTLCSSSDSTKKRHSHGFCCCIIK